MAALNSLWGRLFLPICAVAFALFVFLGCKSSDDLAIRNSWMNTMLVVMRTNSPVVTITNNLGGITITNMGGSVSNFITVTNLFGKNELTKDIVVTLTNVLATNIIEVKATVAFTNAGRLVTGCDCGTDGQQGTTPTTQNGCRSFWCWLGDFVDHNFKEIIGLITTLASLIFGKKLSSRLADKARGEMSEAERAGLTRVIYGLFVVAVLALIFVFWHAAGGMVRVAPPMRMGEYPGSSATNAELAQSLQGLTHAVNQHGDKVQALAGVLSAENDSGGHGEVSIWLKFLGVLGAIISALVAIFGIFIQLRLYVHGKQLEADSVNRAVLAEMRRLLSVVASQQKWRRECTGDSGKENVLYPLLPFKHPVYDAHVERIGVLHRDIVAAVVEFYGWVDFLNRFQATREDYRKTEVVPKAEGDKNQSHIADKLEEFEKRYDDNLQKFMKEFGEKFANNFKDAGIRAFELQTQEKAADAAQEPTLPPKV